ncbi:MAG: carboxypeptidase-like regulatory domain-containing protein [Pseudonocardiaceae bacterium]
MKRFILVASALLCLCAAPVFGQTVISRITGTVKDSQGAVVPGVKVTVIDVGTKKENSTTTNDDGAFVVSDVRPGNYIVEAERSGFKKLQVRDVSVHVDVPVNLNMTLETGDVAATVSVTASGTESLIRTEDAKLSTTIDVKQVQDLPLNGRNPITIAGGMAGVSTNTNVRGAVINGLRGSFSNITWDGIQVNDNLVRTDALFAVNTPSAAGVSEFTLTTQNAGPD